MKLLELFQDFLFRWFHVQSPFGVEVAGFSPLLPACRRLLFPFPRATKEIGDVCTEASPLEREDGAKSHPGNEICCCTVILKGWLISRRTSTPRCPLPWQQVRTDSNDFDWSAADQSEVDQVKIVIMPVELFKWYFCSAAWWALSLG